MKVHELIETFDDNQPETRQELKDQNDALDHQGKMLATKLDQIQSSGAIKLQHLIDKPESTEGRIITKYMSSVGISYYTEIDIIDPSCVARVMKLAERMIRVHDTRRDVLDRLGQTLGRTVASEDV